jgi:8-amino-7-oxononanoate synthase
LQARPELRQQLWNNAHRLYQGLQQMDFDLGPEPSPIVAVRQTQIEAALAKWNGLLEQGIYVNLVLPPATPDGGALLRCSVSAAHTPEQIDQICKAFAALNNGK